MVKGAVYDGASGGPSGSSPSTILLTCTRTHSSGNDLGHCAICPSSSHYSARSLSEAEDTGMRSVGLFPRGSVPGLKHQWNCDLLPFYTHARPFVFKASCQNISLSPLSHFPLLFHSIPSELYLLSSHLITSCIIQSEQGSRSLVVPADSKERDERQRERKGNGRIGEDRSEQRDSEGTVNEMTLTFHEEWRLYVQERGEKSTFRQKFNRQLVQYSCNQNSHAWCQAH